MHKLIISLTTISSRLAHVHIVINSLLNQSFPKISYEIRLYISKSAYLLDMGCRNITGELERLLRKNIGRFSIIYVENTGPYRKIIPVLDEIYSYSTDDFCNTLIITTDDDTIYPPDFLIKLYENFLEHQCVIAFRGRTMRFDGDRLFPYNDWIKVIHENKSLVNVPTGKDGVLYSPLHLIPKVLDIDLAMRFSPKADDLWIKCHSLLAAIPCFIINNNLDLGFPSVTGQDLTVSLYDHFNKNGGNDTAIAELEKYLVVYFGVSFREITLNKNPALGSSLLKYIRQTIKTDLIN